MQNRAEFPHSCHRKLSILLYEVSDEIPSSTAYPTPTLPRAGESMIDSAL